MEEPQASQKRSVESVVTTEDHPCKKSKDLDEKVTTSVASTNSQTFEACPIKYEKNNIVN